MVRNGGSENAEISKEIALRNLIDSDKEQLIKNEMEHILLKTQIEAFENELKREREKSQ